MITFSGYSEVTILFLSATPGREEAWRYCLALDSIVTLLSRCLSPVTFSYALKDYTFFCLGYVDDTLLKPVYNGVRAAVVGARGAARRLRQRTVQPVGGTVRVRAVRLPGFTALTQLERDRTESENEDV